MTNPCKNFRTDYVDLLLVHQPFGDYYGTWRAMEEAYKAGKARAIGVSNFYPDRFVDLADCCEIRPWSIQVETHVFQQQKAARPFLEKYGAQIPILGAVCRREDGNTIHQSRLDRNRQKSTEKLRAQIALRFLVQSAVGRDSKVCSQSAHGGKFQRV